MVGFFKVLISGAPGGIYNIGTEKDEVSMQQLGQMVVDIIGKGSVKLIEYPDSYPADEPTRRCPDISKARTELAYNPVVDLRRGIERTMQWYRDTYSLGG